MKWKILIIILFLFTACEKTDEDGNILYKLYGEGYQDTGNCITLAEDGYYIGGQLVRLIKNGGYITDSFKEAGIIRTDKEGNIKWKETFGKRMTGITVRVMTLDDGSVICLGNLTDTVSLQKDIIVSHFKSDGSGVVQKIFKIPGNQTGADILKTGNGFIILGTTDVERQPLTDSTGNRQGKKDVLLFRIGNNLEQIGTYLSMGFPGDDTGVTLKNDEGGGYIILGVTDRSGPEQADNNILLMKINSDGSATQPVILGGLEDENAIDMELLDDGYLIAGTTGKETDKQTINILRLTKNIYSPPVITRTISAANSSWAVRSMNRYRGDYFVLAGQSGNTANARMLVFVVDPYGNQVEGMQKIFGGAGSQTAYDVVSDSENIIVVGKDSYENNSLVSLIKFRF